MIKRPLFFVACVFVLGIISGIYQNVVIMIMGGIMLVISLIPLIIHKNIFAFFLTILFMVCIFCISFSLSYKQIKYIRNLNQFFSESEAVYFVGKIISVDSSDYSNRYIISGCRLWKDSPKDISQGMRLKRLLLESKENYYVGETIEGYGVLHEFESAHNYGNFDEKKYYLALEIPFKVKVAGVDHRDYKKSILTNALIQLKERLQNAFDDSFSQNHSAILKAMMLGDKRNLSRKQKQSFQKAGVSHLLVVSGLHLSLLGMGLFQMLRKRRVNKYVSALISALMVINYVVLTGNGISAKRALLMFFLTTIGTLLGRSSDLLNSLGFAVIVLLFSHPLWILSDSLLLSVSAILGIGLFGVLGVTLVTMPVSLSAFFTVSPYAYVVNAILIPVVPILMTLIALGTLLSLFSITGWIAWLVYLPCKILLYLIEFVCYLFGRMPGAELIVGKPSIVRIIFFYSLLGVALWWRHLSAMKASSEENKRIIHVNNIMIENVLRKGRQILFSEAILVLAIIFFLAFPEKKNQIAVLDVGQGDGIAIQSKTINCFVDGGSLDVSEVGFNRILPHLKAKGIRQVDYWFVSHLDEDHISGLLELIQCGYPVKTVVVSEQIYEKNRGHELFSLMRHNKINLIKLKPDDILSCEEFKLITLDSTVDDFADSNDCSLCLFFESDKMKGLLCGDISAEVEEGLCKKYPSLICNINWYKCNHHGSKYSSADVFLNLIHPEFTTISCGKNNRFGHPASVTLERLERISSSVYRTDISGEIDFVF